MQSYQLTKAIRFKLEPLNGALSAEVQTLKNQGDSTTQIQSLYTQAQDLLSTLQNYLYISSDEKRF